MGTLFYTQSGKGKTVVLLHGFCETHELWQDFVPELSKTCSVISCDMGGFGKSEKLLPQNVSIEALADQVYEMLQKITSEKCTIIGHSLGGYVGLAFAKKYSEKLSGLGLFHSTALADSEEKKNTRDKTITFIEKVGVEKWVETFVSPLFYKERHQALQKEISFIEKIASKTPKNTVISVMKAMRNRSDATETLKNAVFPVLFIIGKQDASIPLETYADQVLMPANATIHILDQTAHIGMLERPQETLKMLVDFLNR